MDTNILSDFIDQELGRVAQRMSLIGTDTLCTSIIVAGELRSGAEKRKSRRLTMLVDGTLERFPVLPLEAPFDQTYGRLRAQLEAAGRPLDGNDLLIAAHALSLDCVMVTADRAFVQVPGLTVENWLA